MLVLEATCQGYPVRRDLFAARSAAAEAPLSYASDVHVNKIRMRIIAYTSAV